MSQNGLKDHQIAGLVNQIRGELQHLIPHQCLRELIHQAAIKYLEDNNLRLDQPKVDMKRPWRNVNLVCARCGLTLGEHKAGPGGFDYPASACPAKRQPLIGFTVWTKHSFKES